MTLYPPKGTLDQGGIDAALASRARTVENHKNGLGPPDLCYTVRVHAAGIMRQQVQTCQYHYVHGIEISSPAAVAAYFVELSKRWEGLQRGVYCCYNAFIKADVRMEFIAPATITSYLVERNSTVRNPEITDTNWTETQVCATLRSLALLDGAESVDFLEQTESNEGVVVAAAEPIPTLAAEKSFLRAADMVFWRGHMLGAPPNVTATKCLNNLSLGILNYFLSASRFSQAEIYFGKFRPINGESVVLIARALAANPHVDTAVPVALLAKAFTRELQKTGEKNQLILIEQSQLLARMKSFSDAVYVAERAQSCPGRNLVLATLNLADIYNAAGRPAVALCTLNAVVLESQRVAPRPVLDAWGTPLVADFTTVEKPVQRTSSGGKGRTKTGFMSRNLWSPPEETADDGWNMEQRGLLQHPGFSSLGISPRVLSIVLRICRKMGWQDLLACRNRIFLSDGWRSSDAPVVEHGVTLEKRACARWLDETVRWLHTSYRLLSYWCVEAKSLSGTISGSAKCASEVMFWSAAARIACTLNDQASFRLFLSRIPSESTIHAILLVLVMLQGVVHSDVNRSLILLSKLEQVTGRVGREQLFLDREVANIAAQTIAAHGKAKTMAALEALNMERSGCSSILARAIEWKVCGFDK
eukprot:m.1105378 g.1105378  ORF g.1105378 m.1105378 type:complete len:645 (-) comp24339_c0_seq1:236-2170(-)